MRIIEVKSKSEARDFHRVPHIVYLGDDAWICPIEKEIEMVFDASSNKYFKNGEAARWVLMDDKGRLLGRVAAFINYKRAYTFEQATGGIGFYECIDDQNAAFRLFDTCRQWLEEKGMKAMDGPINFGENDSWWGLLVEGFTQPAYQMNYHKPYYRRQFEEYGFYPYFEQVTHHLDITKPFPERFWKIAEWTVRRPGIHFRTFSYKDIDKLLTDFKIIHDDAWQFHEGFTPLDIDELRYKVESSRPAIIEEFIMFAYHDDTPIGIFVMFPDINVVLKPLKGKFHLLNKARLLLSLKRHRIWRSRVVVLGVIPAFQRYGIESVFFWLLERAMRKYPEYREIEISWVGDFNPKMQALLAAFNANPAKKHITFRKLFDAEAEARRMATIPVDTKEKALGS